MDTNPHTKENNLVNPNILANISNKNNDTSAYEENISYAHRCKKVTNSTVQEYWVKLASFQIVTRLFFHPILCNPK